MGLKSNDLPRKLYLDGLEWEVSVVDLGHDQAGECRGEECHILIANRLTAQVREQTFWHELLHALARTRDFDVDKKHTEEEFCTFFGPALFAFLKSNCSIEWRHE